MNRRWILPPATDPLLTGQLLRELEIPAFLGVLLTQRGHGSIAEAREFLHPKLKSLQPPEALPQMDVAAERVWAAVRAGRRIVLYGDYDVDGITSLALLARVLKAFGGKVECFLPLRVEEGYGLSPAGIERCCELHRPELLLAVDCGTTSVREIASLRSRGVEVIVLDHHEPGSERPDCAALVNPKCGNNFHYLCSAGVVFKLAHAMQKLSPVADLDLRHYLDMVALATVADIVPLTGENRIFVRHGLQRMAATRWVGIAALMRVSGVSAPVRTSDVGFRLGPRINAAGRLGPAQEALRLLLTDDPDEAARLAANLDAHNRERQDVEKAVVRDAEILKGFQSVVDDSDSSGDLLFEAAKHVEGLLNKGEHFEVSLSTTFGQPLPPQSRRATLIVPKQRVRIRGATHGGRPKAPICFLSVGSMTTEQPIALTYELFRAVKELAAGMSQASLPRPVVALLDTTRARLSGPLVRDEELLEDSEIRLGTSGELVSRSRHKFVVRQETRR